MKFVLSAAIAALLLAACSSNQQTSTETTTSAAPSGGAVSGATPMASSALKGGTMAAGGTKVMLKAMNGSGETGTATLTPVGKLTRVDIALTHEPAGGKQPAHIHQGSCAQLNPTPKYALKDVVAGKSSTIVNVSSADLHAAKYAINVHQSAANLPKYVSCGDVAGGMAK